MEKKKKPADHSNRFTIKVILIAIFFVSVVVGIAIYIYTFPRTTIHLYNDEGIEQDSYTKYLGSTLRLNEVPEIYKKGHSFTYWSYDEGGLTRVENGTSLDEMEYHFYGQFERNTYNINYYIQVENEDKTDYIYTLYTTQRVLYADKFTAPSGVDESTGTLTSLLTDRLGYTFDGWSTGVEFEESIANNENLIIFDDGKEALYNYDIDLNLYAIWKKDSYDVNLYTGLKYEIYSASDITGLVENKDYVVVDDAGIPKYYAIDSNGDYIIKNDTVDEEDVSIKYLDYFASAIDRYEEYSLDANYCVGASEYDFLGWYLTDEYSLNMTTRQTIQVDVDPVTRIPYLKDAYGTKLVDAHLVSEENGVKQYEFRVYSKWVRRSYNVSFTDVYKTLSSSGYKIYKYDDLYGKLYTTSINLKPIMNNYLGLDEEGNAIDGVTSVLGADHSAVVKKGDATYRYKFIGWKDNTNNASYYNWSQEEVTEFGLAVDYITHYTEDVYTHLISDDAVLSASWAQQFEIVYKKKTGFTKYQSKVYAIIGEYVKLYSDLEMFELGPNASNIVSPPANQEMLGWVSHGNKNSNTPTLFSSNGKTFYCMQQTDLLDQDKNTIFLSTNTFMFYSYFVSTEPSGSV